MPVSVIAFGDHSEQWCPFCGTDDVVLDDGYLCCTAAFGGEDAHRRMIGRARACEWAARLGVEQICADH